MNDVSDGGVQTPFQLGDLHYELPEALIAQQPLPKRDASRLLCLDRAGGGIRDACMNDLPELLAPGDLLVMNNTKVIQAKFTAMRKTGGRVSGLYVEEDRPGVWRVMLEGSRRLHLGETLTVGEGSDNQVNLRLDDSLGEGTWLVSVDSPGRAEEILERVGEPPLPPYIHRRRGRAGIDPEDRSRYQTVFARVPGAIAAPTAGLHLTKTLLDRMRACGVDTTFVTLHVGVGTFKPISAKTVAQHVMHAERYELSGDTAGAVELCRKGGGRVIAVGTTTLRTLESAASGRVDRLVNARGGTTNLFIYPPYEFRVVDALLTNFHLPSSTLLALVMALAGVDPIRRAYQHAIDRQYRFYSYGDAMFIQ